MSEVFFLTDYKEMPFKVDISNELNSQLCWFLVQCVVILNCIFFLFDHQILSKKKDHERFFKKFFGLLIQSHFLLSIV